MRVAAVQRGQRPGFEQVVDGDRDRSRRRVQFAQPLFGRLGPPERFEVALVEEGVEVIGRIVEEVHVDLGAVDLVGEAAPPAVEVILPLGHPRHGAALLDAFRVPERAAGGEVGG
ncbi:MAG TPA: hypothetical protein VH092_16080 [Urbifossiella sp.]|nr:hypothetical protein [Urbifossiella sp.]